MLVDANEVADLLEAEGDVDEDIDLEALRDRQSTIASAPMDESMLIPRFIINIFEGDDNAENPVTTFFFGFLNVSVQSECIEYFDLDDDEAELYGDTLGLAELQPRHRIGVPEDDSLLEELLSNSTSFEDELANITELVVEDPDASANDVRRLRRHLEFSPPDSDNWIKRGKDDFVPTSFEA